MPITISRKKLSTQKGQQGLIAAIDMEKTLGTGVENFSGDPSLRALFIDEINTFPFTDELFDLQIRVGQRACEDSTKQREWLESKVELVKDPGVIARYCTSYRHRLKPTVTKVDRALLRKACWLMDQYTLSYLIAAAFEEKAMEPMYLAAELKHKDAHASDIGGHMQQAVVAWGESRREVFPGLVYMVNQYILRYMASDDPLDVTSVWENLSKYYVRTFEGLSVTMTLRNPMAYKAPVVLKSLLEKENL